MIPRSVALLASALAGCTVDHALITSETGQEFPFCPTTIDVYGGENVLLPGCGGPTAAPSPTRSGFFSPGTPSFDATLAGRLQARLSTDAELVARLGATWKVRSCADAGETTAALAAPIAEDYCGAPEAPGKMGMMLDVCSETPAPVLLLSATGEDDGCHGGSEGSTTRDDKDAYSAHLATRIEAVLAARKPSLAVIGPRTEWYADPGVNAGPDGGVSALARCAWKRGDWDESGVRLWQTQHADRKSVFLFGHLHDECRQHNPCCTALGVGCAAAWFTAGSRGTTLLNCDGAQALLDFWYSRLRKLLLQNRFRCP